MSDLETLPKPMVRDLYGKALEDLLVGQQIDIPEEDRMRVINYLTRKYKKDRLFRSIKADGIRKVFRVK